MVNHAEVYFGSTRGCVVLPSPAQASDECLAFSRSTSHALVTLRVTPSNPYLPRARAPRANASKSACQLCHIPGSLLSELESAAGVMGALPFAPTDRPWSVAFQTHPHERCLALVPDVSKIAPRIPAASRTFSTTTASALDNLGAPICQVGHCRPCVLERAVWRQSRPCARGISILPLPDKELNRSDQS
jgi:hypothetical protein